MDKSKKYIKLVYETGWKHPVQAYSIRYFPNHKKWISRHFFAEWDSFEDAEEWLKHGHPNHIIIKEPQIKMKL